MVNVLGINRKGCGRPNYDKGICLNLVKMYFKIIKMKFKMNEMKV